MTSCRKGGGEAGLLQQTEKLDKDTSQHQQHWGPDEFGVVFFRYGLFEVAFLGMGFGWMNLT